MTIFKTIKLKTLNAYVIIMQTYLLNFDKTIHNLGRELQDSHIIKNLDLH